MKTEIVSATPHPYLLVLPDEGLLAAPRDANDILSACFSEGVTRVLLAAPALSDAFFTLSSGLLGEVCQKFTNYHIRTAIALEGRKVSARFREWAGEVSKGSALRVFDEMDDAARWLAGE
ncbi:MAG: DUF4180 domain-containing protein [Oscillospiraceae bacterium]|jgi:hypothetical protein|nr:DUF4180 domain-containing protein [Oscillospiraceae bacterium]